MMAYRKLRMTEERAGRNDPVVLFEINRRDHAVESIEGLHRWLRLKKP